MNQVICVGRVVQLAVIGFGDNNPSGAIQIAVKRNYQNEDGIYDTDIIPCILNGSLATNAMKYCKAEDVIGVRGRLKTEDDKLVVVADKITFLASRKREK
jgi:single-stranded DNA-binding protein